MSQELLYTSAPRGLKPGSRGFCTVLCTHGMPAPLAAAVEGLSGYRPIFPPSDDRAARNPIVYSHLKMQATGRTWHVLSRIADYGLDYSQRANKLAHHVILDDPAERLTGGPANLISMPGFMREEWSDEPKVVALKPVTREPRGPTGVCRHWQELTGDAGWAGVLAESFLKDPERLVILLFSPGQEVLPLFAEALSLVPPDRRWDVTFSTYFTGLATGTTCVWRALIHDSKEARDSLRFVNALRIDLTSDSLGQPVGGPLVEAARTGERFKDDSVDKTPSSNEQHGSHHAQKIIASPGIQKPSHGIPAPPTIPTFDNAATMRTRGYVSGKTLQGVRHTSRRFPIFIAAAILSIASGVLLFGLWFNKRKISDAQTSDKSKSLAHSEASANETKTNPADTHSSQIASSNNLISTNVSQKTSIPQTPNMSDDPAKLSTANVLQPLDSLSRSHSSISLIEVNGSNPSKDLSTTEPTRRPIFVTDFENDKARIYRFTWKNRTALSNFSALFLLNVSLSPKHRNNEQLQQVLRPQLNHLPPGCSLLMPQWLKWKLDKYPQEKKPHLVAIKETNNSAGGEIATITLIEKSPSDFEYYLKLVSEEQKPLIAWCAFDIEDPAATPRESRILFYNSQTATSVDTKSNSIVSVLRTANLSIKGRMHQWQTNLPYKNIPAEKLRVDEIQLRNGDRIFDNVGSNMTSGTATQQSECIITLDEIEELISKECNTQLHRSNRIKLSVTISNDSDSLCFSPRLIGLFENSKSGALKTVEDHIFGELDDIRKRIARAADEIRSVVDIKIAIDDLLKTIPSPNDLSSLTSDKQAKIASSTEEILTQAKEAQGKSDDVTKKLFESVKKALEYLPENLVDVHSRFSRFRVLSEQLNDIRVSRVKISYDLFEQGDKNYEHPIRAMIVDYVEPDAGDESTHKEATP